MIRVEAIKKSFGENKVLNNISIDFHPSLTHGIIGLNGAGKTTFFDIVATFLKPDSGEVFFNGRKITRDDVAYLETTNFFLE
ncbi:MAG TPA: ATP-binding cassette domain-containing protein [Hanamia sp.]